MSGRGPASGITPEAAGAAPEVDADEIDRIIAGIHHDPHSVLGAHPGPDGVQVRELLPMAKTAAVVLPDGRRFLMTHLHEGVFGCTLPLTEVPDYRIAVAYPGPEPGSTGPETVIDSPYRFLPTLGETDLHLIGEGRHEQLWQVLGAHVREYGTDGIGLGKVSGTAFAVWAPNAHGARVIGDFNHWDGRGHPMRSLGGSGVWELFVPGVGDGTHYKFDICGPDGRWRRKADPLASRAEHPPATASVVFTSEYTWGDEGWLAARRRGERVSEPVSIYEVHLGSWRPGLSYRQLADELTAYVTEMGFTHVELLPVAEHPFGGSWGYQVTSYYAPTARYGSPDDFRFLVDRLHQAGIGVILDWVPAHFPRDDWALARFDGTPLYEHADPRLGEHPDWGTLIFNFGRNEVRNFLVANALCWLEDFHADGLRVDAVASMLYLDYSRGPGQWTPNEHGGRENTDAVSFLREVNATCYRRVPGIMMIAEESTAWPGVTRPVYLGGLGFGFKWNLGWMHDTLNYLANDPVFRHYHHNEITFSLMYAFSENFVLPLSHDEVVHGKRSLLGKVPGDEHHAGVQQLVTDLNRAYRENPALWALDYSPEGFGWIDANDAGGNVLSFLRFSGEPMDPGPETARAGSSESPDGSADGEAPADGEAVPGSADGAAASPGVLACIINFSGRPHMRYKVGLPRAGRWREIVNTDAFGYGGSGVGNLGSVEAVPEPYHGQPASAVMTLPPLGALWLVPEA